LCFSFAGLKEELVWSKEEFKEELVCSKRSWSGAVAQ
jgi:hypothetical protein